MKNLHKDPLSGGYEEILRLAKALNENLPPLKTRFAITDAELAALNQFCTDGERINLLAKRTWEFWKQVNQYHRDFFYGQEQELIFPVTSELGRAEALSKRGGLAAFMRGLIRKIKNSSHYTVSLGDELGIIGVQITFDTENAQPLLKANLHDDHLHFTYKKNHFTGANLYCNFNDGLGPRLVGYMAKTAFDLAVEFPADATEWVFYAKYVLDGKEVGQASPELRISVKQQHQN